MKSYVITIADLEESVQSAQRCIKSASSYGIDVEHKSAITPKDDPISMLYDLGIPLSGFQEKYSRIENCVAAFLSHRSLWEECVNLDEEILIFEHDAVVTAAIPVNVPYKKLISYAQPSYGKYNDPLSLGVNPLTSKPYLPGAHAYRLKPQAAKELIEKAKTSAQPTDIFINLNNFPWIEEYYPWPVQALDSFTTIQNKVGCIAKHGFGDDYRIL